jgi:branched-chain amino acid transport system ATP-binding protein
MSSSSPILATRNLGLDIGGATIVADVTLAVEAGEFLGIIGPNGAGKTSLFNLLTGLYQPTTGTVELDGRDITHTSPHRRTNAGLGRTFQISSVFPRLTALENVRLGSDSRTGSACRRDRWRTVTSASSSSRCCSPVIRA